MNKLFLTDRQNMARLFLLCSAIGGFLAVALGAFGAHGLRSILSEQALATWQTAVQYQMFHSLALLAVSIFYQSHPSKALKLSGLAFILGGLLFSGSLYALALGVAHGVGIITPFGGVSFLVGWIGLFIAAWRLHHHNSQ